MENEEERNPEVEALIESNLRLVLKIANDFLGRGLPWEDLVSEGNRGLVIAARRYDPARGARFSTYSACWIKQAIHQAIAEDRQIEFRYCSYTITKEKKFRRGGRPYRVSPLALSWAEENYYLIAYEAEADKIKHFRVDKMDGIQVTEMFRQGKNKLPEKEMGEYARKNFSMFGGQEEQVTLRFSNRMIGVVIDTFGKDVAITSLDEDHFQIRTTVAVSPQFFGWLFGLDGEAAITAPREVMDRFAAQMERVKAGC